MSFSSEVKDELIGVRLRRESDGQMLVKGYTLAAASLKYSRAHRSWGLHYVSENTASIGFVAKLACRSYELEQEISLNVHERLNARNTELLLYGKGIDKLGADSGLWCFDENGDRSLELHEPEGLDSEHGCRAFIRGMFLACGSVSDPSRGCHAEMVFKGEFAANTAASLLSQRDIIAKVTKRKSQYVVYMKNGDTVEDFLTFMGAGEAMLAVREHRMLREMKNNSNREVNCFLANTEKAAKASAQQVEDIKLIVASLGTDQFSEELYSVAEARMAYPEFTLTELANHLGIGKSAVNYRLKKIAALAAELRERQ